MDLYINGTQGTIAISVQYVTSNQSNASSMPEYFDIEDSPTYVFIRRFQTVLIPVIFVLGIVGNILAAGTFLSPSLNKTSCCFHMAAKSLNDIGFLLTLFVVWLYRIRVPLFTTPGVCQITVFLTYLCGCMSVWFVVAITAENFIRFTQPRLVSKYCNIRMAKRLVAAAYVTSALFYNFSLWSSGVVVMPNGTKECTTLAHFQLILMATTYIDTALTFLIPSLLIFFLILGIVYKSVESLERKKRLQKAAKRGERKRLTPECKMTTFLFVTSIIFLALNLPLHAFRLKLLIQVMVQNRPYSFWDGVLQRLFEILLHFNFSTNCLIYLMCGERFRTVFKCMYLKRCRSKQHQPVEVSMLTEHTEGCSSAVMRQTVKMENEESVRLTYVNGTDNSPRT